MGIFVWYLKFLLSWIVFEYSLKAGLHFNFCFLRPVIPLCTLQRYHKRLLSALGAHVSALQEVAEKLSLTSLVLPVLFAAMKEKTGWLDLLLFSTSCEILQLTFCQSESIILFCQWVLCSKWILESLLPFCETYSSD